MHDIRFHIYNLNNNIYMCKEKHKKQQHFGK